MGGVKAGTAYIDIQGDFSALNKQIDAAVAPISGKFGKLGKAGAVGLAAIGAAAVGAGAALYDIGGQFDDAYDTIRVGTGKTGKALKGLEGDFKAVVKTVPTDFGSASTAISQLNSRLGITGKPLRSLSGQVLELSRITKTDLSGNIESVTRLFGDWSIKTKNQAGALDKLFRASQATNVPISKLSDLMTKFGGPLRQLGFGFNQAAALVGKFQKEGVNTELVMGSLRIALGRMAKQGVKDPQEALAKLTAEIKGAGSAGEANKLALETFGARAGPDMAAAIREGRFEIGDLQKTIAGGKDTIMGASKDTQDFGEKWQLIKNRVLVGLEPLATAVFGAVGTAMDKLPGIVDTIRGAFDNFKASLGGGEGGGFASKAAQSFQQLKDAVVTTFTTIVTVGGALWRTFGDTIVDHLKDTVTMVAGVLQGIITAFKGIVDIISGVLTGDWGKAWTGVKEVFSGVWQAIGAVVTGAWENIKTIVSLGVTAIGTVIKAAAGALLDLGKWIVGQIVAGFKAYASLWVGAASWVLTTVKNAITALAGNFKNRGEDIIGWIAEGLRTVGGMLAGFGGWLVTTLKNGLTQSAGFFANRGEEIIDWIAGGIRTVTDKLGNVGSWLVTTLKNGVVEVGTELKSVGSSILGFVVEGLNSGVKKLKSFLKTIIGLVNRIPGVEISVDGLAQGGQFSAAGVEGFATGGQVRRGTKLTAPMIMMGEEAPCIAEGTLVETAAGRRAIESVAAGERVLTRHGYREVLWSGITRRDAEVLRVTSVSGDNVLCTPDHRIWMARGDDDGDGRRDCMGGGAVRGRGMLPVYRPAGRQEPGSHADHPDDGPRHHEEVSGCRGRGETPRPTGSRTGSEADLRGGHRGARGRAADHRRVPAVAGGATRSEGARAARSHADARRGSGDPLGVLQAGAPSYAGERLHDAERLRGLQDLQAGRGTRVDAREAAEGPGVRATATRGIPRVRSTEARWREARELTVGDWIWTLAADGELRATRIASIAPADRIDTYDLVVDQDHEFVAGGILVHNSHPEYVIPTNPAYRKRALGLYGQLGSALGVGYADGGVIGHASGVLSDVGKAVVKTVTGVLPTGLLEKGASWLLDKLPNPADMLPDWLVGTGKYVIDKVGDWIKDKITGLLGSSGGVQGAGAGVGQFDGKPVASWIIPILKAARASGVAFNVSSGFRSFAEQTRLWNQLGRDPAIVARPGTSNHEGSAYPRGAVDISPGWQALSAWLAQRNLPLHHYGNPRDPYHFSATGHAKGGIIQGPFVGSYKNGGVIPRDGLAYVHQGETITPANTTVEVNFRDDRLKDLIEVVVVENGRRQGAMMRAGVI